MIFTKLLKQMPGFIGGKGCADEEIAVYENALGIRFAPDYRNYLMEIGLACFDNRELTGICKNPRLNVVTVTQENREIIGEISANWYVIEETGYDGIVFWQAEDGFIYKTMPNRIPRIICNSLVEYLLID